MDNQSKQNLTTYFPILVAVLGIAVTWGMYSQRISADESTIAGQDIRITVLERTLVDLRLDTATIKSDVAFIREKVK